jgi:NAD(P)-dependent dehydrogenase (short-subunit alcohol dehydrogenase family)
MSPQTKTVLVTGSSAGGIGASLVLAFQRQGLHVFATARSLSKMEQLAKLPNVTLLELDVTSEASIAAAVQAVEAHGSGLDILVNNAGLVMHQPAAEPDFDLAKTLFDVNFWGVVKVTAAFTPLLVKSKGAVVNIGSMNGRINAPWMSMYAASKAAAERYSETLAIELAPFGVRVLTVTSGSVQSSMGSNNLKNDFAEHSIFKPAEKDSRVRGESIPRMDADKYAGKIVADVLAGRSGTVWRGYFASRMRMCLAILPTWVIVSTPETICIIIKTC